MSLLYVQLLYSNWISSLILSHTSLEMLALTLFKNTFPWKFISCWISNWKLWQLRIIFLAGLEHDEKRALMFCKYCKEHDRSVRSFGSMRVESLQSHWSTEQVAFYIYDSQSWHKTSHFDILVFSKAHNGIIIWAVLDWTWFKSKTKDMLIRKHFVMAIYTYLIIVVVK